MAQLFGRTCTRQFLLERVGNISQLGGVRLVTLADGVESGVEAADFRTGTGFNFTVLISRGLDISWAEFCGRSLCWHSPSGQTHPSYYDAEGLGWLRSFSGGLCVTCGLTHAGAPCEDQGKSLGLHGRISNSPASQVSVGHQWEGDDLLFWVEGKVAEAMIFGENICLTRRISARLGEPRLWIDDTVENMGFSPTEHMILYHINAGFPVVDEGSELVAPTLEAAPRDAEAAAGAEELARFGKPVSGYLEKVYYHDMACAQDGQVRAAIVNRALDGGLGLYVSYNCRELPRFIEWKMVGQGTYVVGMEPANCLVEGRDKERARGTLQFLQPGEKRRYRLEIGVLCGADELKAHDQWIADALAARQKTKG
jgi:hypothetical protein